MEIALVHYAYPPVVGGVETVMAAHALLFAEAGHTVRVVTGVGGGDDEIAGVSTILVPGLAAADTPEEVEDELVSGQAGEAFRSFRDKLESRFAKALEGCDLVIVHNLMTMPFQLAATAALAQLAAEGCLECRFINWIHDIAAIDPNYALAERLGSEPWGLLSEAQPGFEHVAVSARRRDQFCALVDVPPEECKVVPNGIDPLELLDISGQMRGYCRRHRLLDRELVLLQPARIIRRKAIEVGVRALAALRACDVDAAYVVTGAPDPHNPASAEYGSWLRESVAGHGVGDHFLFAGDETELGSAEVAMLYRVCDAVFLPSRAEGFGLPVLEAALQRVPVFCAGGGTMAELLDEGVHSFDPAQDPREIADLLVKALGEDVAFRARRQVRREYSWRSVYESKIRPALGI